MTSQTDLFAKHATDLPEGFRYSADIITSQEERGLIALLQTLPFKEFEFHGFFGRRRVVSFGWRYDFNAGGLQKIDPIPDFLLPLRERAVRFAGIDAATVEHALITEYREGAPIGWHKDRPVFDDVIGVSFHSPCTFRFRRKAARGWERRSLTVAPRSVYLLRGPSRWEWEHSIPAAEALRYSVTFRTLRR